MKDVELSPVVNRDLSRRVRPVTGATTAKQVIRDDIKLAAKLIRVLDKRAALYEKESREETEAREKAEKEAAEVSWDRQSHTVTQTESSTVHSIPSVLNLRRHTWRFYTLIATNLIASDFRHRLMRTHQAIFLPIAAMWHFNLVPGLHPGAFLKSRVIKSPYLIS